MEKLLSAIEEAKLLGYFKTFCDKNNSATNKQRIRNIIANANNSTLCIIGLFKNEVNADLSNTQAERMKELVVAFLNKSSFRNSISLETKQQLLITQHNKCAICNTDIDIHAHADHIVPFKYVGDELNNNHNLQMLCDKCNRSKNASMDYQIKHLFKLI